MLKYHCHRILIFTVYEQHESVVLINGITNSTCQVVLNSQEQFKGIKLMFHFFNAFIHVHTSFQKKQLHEIVFL